MDYGNCPYAAANSKPGEKKLRSRIRVGFAMDANSETIQDYLHTGLRQLGRGAGCYPSPLPYGEIIIYESAEFERPKHVLAKINSSRLSTGSPVEQPHERAKFCCHHGDKHAEKEEEEEKE